MTEAQIIQGCKEMDRKCQRALVKLYSGILFTVCRRYCREEFMANEALQMGLIRVFKYIDRFDPSKGSFIGWMKKIVSNESIKLLQKNRDNQIIEISELEISDFSANALDNLHEEELIAMIQELPLGYREVFNMYVIDGYSHNEIASMLNISESTSRSQLSRAKKLLQKKISMIENLQLCRKNA